MNIEQLKKIAKLTRSKKSIELLLNEDDETTKSITATVDRLNKADVIYTEDGINKFIELIRDNKERQSFDDDICTILKAITNKYRTNQEININDINYMIELYIVEGYSKTTINIIKNFKPILSLEDFTKLYNSLKSVNFEVNLKQYSLENEDIDEFIPTRTIDEVCNLIKEDNGLNPTQISEIYFDEDMLKYRTYEESKKIGDKVMEAYNSEEYNEKIKKDKHNETTDIELIATDKALITRMKNDEHLSLMNEFINNPSYELYKILSNRDLLEHRTYFDLMELIKLYKANPDTYEGIVNHKLLLLPIHEQIQYINLIITSKSPYIKDLLLYSEEPITKDTITKIRKLNEPVSIEKRLNETSIDDFIKSLEDNGIEDFDGKTLIYVKD